MNTYKYINYTWNNKKYKIKKIKCKIQEKCKKVVRAGVFTIQTAWLYTLTQ